MRLSFFVKKCYTDTKWMIMRLKMNWRGTMNINLHIKLTAKDLYKFNLRQVYRGLQGILSIILPALLVANAIISYGRVDIKTTVIYVVLGIVFLVYIPISLWLRVNKLIKDESNVLSGVLEYAFSEEGLKVAAGEESVFLEWERIHYVVRTGGLLLIFTNRIHAYVLPVEQIGENYDRLVGLMRTKLEKHRIKIK